MTTRTPVHRLQVADPLLDFIDRQVLPGTGVDRAAFWHGFDALVHDLAPKNAALLAIRVLSLHDEGLRNKLHEFHERQTQLVMQNRTPAGPGMGS